MNRNLAWAVFFTIATVIYSCWMFSHWPPDKQRETAGQTPLTPYPKRQADLSTTSRGSPLPSYAHYIQRPWQTCDSFLDVRTRPGSAYVIKLVDSWNGHTVLSYYLPGGVHSEIDVPSGTYEIRYTTGTEWFGDVQLFGPSGRYAKAQGTFAFDKNSGYELTLYSVPHGNLGTTPIRPQDF